MRFTSGNLLEAKADALVNTVNTVGVMGKGIALMFKEKFPGNFALYEEACAAGEVKVGHIMATKKSDLYGPLWIINFPTKKHWRHPAKIEWIADGLRELKQFIIDNDVRSIAIPPLGAGNGGLNWEIVKPVIEAELSGLDEVDILVFEPTQKYQNVAKSTGVEKLTPARALVAELVRRYAVLGLECTLLEVQKLTWFMSSRLNATALPDPFKLAFEAHRYGPYSDGLRHLLNGLDGSYLRCDKRISDAGPLDIIRFNDSKKEQVEAYLSSEEARQYRPILESISRLIDGFESPLGMELLATIDWLLKIENRSPAVPDILGGIESWAGGTDAAKRKANIFNPRLVEIALDRLKMEMAAA